MAHVTRRLRPDGLTQLSPREQHVQRPEWYLAAFSVLLLSWGLFISTAIPPQLVGALLLGGVVGEACFAVRALLERRNPPAEVLVLARTQRRL